MPEVTIVARLVDCDPDAVFEHAARFESYADIAPNVRSVEVSGEGDELISRWEVNFRNGILKWEERDLIDRARRRIVFAQTQGDLAVFRGEWLVTATDGEVQVHFSAEFDLGIPTLASMLDPAAARTLRKNGWELIEAFARAAGAPPPTPLGGEPPPAPPAGHPAGGPALGAR